MGFAGKIGLRNCWIFSAHSAYLCFLCVNHIGTNHLTQRKRDTQSAQSKYRSVPSVCGTIEVQSGFGLADENELVTEECLSQPSHSPVKHVEKAECPAFACRGQNQRQGNWRHACTDHLETAISGYLLGALEREEPQVRFVEDAHAAVVKTSK